MQSDASATSSLEEFKRTVTPQADLGQFVEEQLASFVLGIVIRGIVVLEKLSETSGQFKDGSRRASESVAFLSLHFTSAFEVMQKIKTHEEDIVVFPELGCAESLM